MTAHFNNEYFSFPEQDRAKRGIRTGMQKNWQMLASSERRVGSWDEFGEEIVGGFIANCDENSIHSHAVVLNNHILKTPRVSNIHE